MYWNHSSVCVCVCKKAIVLYYFGDRNCNFCLHECHNGIHAGRYRLSFRRNQYFIHISKRSMCPSGCVHVCGFGQKFSLI